MIFVAHRARACPSAAVSASSTALTMRKFLSFGFIQNSYAPKVFRMKRSTTKTIWRDRYRSIRHFEAASAPQRHAYRQVLLSTFPKTSSANAFLPASKSRIRTGSSAGPTSKKGNIGTITWTPMKLA